MNEHIVKPGDNLWTISKQHHVSLQDLKNANPALEHRVPPWGVNPGDKVSIPEAQPPNQPYAGAVSKCKPCPPCPKYDSPIDRSKPIDSYNCAGLAHRTYTYIPNAAAVKARLAGKEVPSSKKCEGCQVRHWLWEIYIAEAGSAEKDASGNATNFQPLPALNFKPTWDFHTVAAKCDCDGNPESSIISKNGKRPLEGPAPPQSFRLPEYWLVTKNDASAALTPLTPGRYFAVHIMPTIETCYCVDCA